MNLTDLQSELREIERRIATLHGEIERMKPMSFKTKAVEYDAIDMIAKKHPLVRRTLMDASNPYLKTIYVISLAYFFQISEADNIEQLLYLCRIARGIGLNIGAENIVKASLDFEGKHRDGISDELIEYRYTYLADAVVIANLRGLAKKSSLEIIADLARMLDCEKEDFRVVAQVAKCTLIDRFYTLNELPDPTDNHWSGVFNDFISEEWLASQRMFCGRVSKDRITNHRIKAGSLVKTGDIIVNKGGKITARKNGRVYFVDVTEKGGIFIQKLLDIFVVSYFDDYESFCKWHQENRKLFALTEG